MEKENQLRLYKQGDTTNRNLTFDQFKLVANLEQMKHGFAFTLGGDYYFVTLLIGCDTRPAMGEQHFH